MSTTQPVTRAKPSPAKHAETRAGGEKPLVTLVVPAFNEASIVHASLAALCDYMRTLEDEYRWEIILVNDGSTDETRQIAEAFAATLDNIRVLNHPCNFGLGQAFITAFRQCQGDYVVTLDMDLSYSPQHVRALLEKIRSSRAKIVVASPYLRGGRISNVPALRKMLSIWANRFLSFTVDNQLTTITGMVRAYDGRFLRSLNLRSLGMGVNPEIIFKAMILRARIEEVPAHLDWHFDAVPKAGRQSSIRIVSQVMAVLLSGFLFRPFLFFILPGMALLVFAAYVDAWMVIHFFSQYRILTQYTWFLDRASFAVAEAFRQFPHTFVVGGLSTMLGIQLVSLGILSLQNKRYFEDVFHLGTAILQSVREHGPDKNNDKEQR